MAASCLECDVHKKGQKVDASLPEHAYSHKANRCLAGAGADCTGVALYLKMSSTLRPAQVHRKDCEGL